MRRAGRSSRPSSRRGISAVNSDQVAAQLPVKPEWDPLREREWAATQARAPRRRRRRPRARPRPTRRRPTPGRRSATPPRRAARCATSCSARGSCRALWLPVIVLGTWLLAGEVLGRRRLLQTAAAAAVPALAPMVVVRDELGEPRRDALRGVDARALARRPLHQARRCRCATAWRSSRSSGSRARSRPTSYALVPAALLVAVARADRRADACSPGAPPSSPSRRSRALAAHARRLGPGRRAAGPAGRRAARPQGGGQRRHELARARVVRLAVLPAAHAGPAGVQDASVGYPLLQVWITQGWAAFGGSRSSSRRGSTACSAPLTVAVLGAALVALVQGVAARRPARARLPRRRLRCPARRPALDRVPRAREPAARRSCRAATCSR